MIYGIFRLMNNWQVNNSSCLWKRNHQRGGRRNRRSKQRKPQKTKEKEKLHLFPQRLYSKALYTQSSSFYCWWTSGQMAHLSVSNREIQGSNPFSTTSNVLKNCHHFIDILKLTLYLIFYPNDFFYQFWFDKSQEPRKMDTKSEDDNKDMAAMAMSLKVYRIVIPWDLAYLTF